MPALTERAVGVVGAGPALASLLRWVRPTFALAGDARPALDIGYFANVIPVAPNLGIAIGTGDFSDPHAPPWDGGPSPRGHPPSS